MLDLTVVANDWLAAPFYKLQPSTSRCSGGHGEAQGPCGRGGASFWLIRGDRGDGLAGQSPSASPLRQHPSWGLSLLHLPSSPIGLFPLDRQGALKRSGRRLTMSWEEDVAAAEEAIGGGMPGRRGYFAQASEGCREDGLGLWRGGGRIEKTTMTKKE